MSKPGKQNNWTPCVKIKTIYWLGPRGSLWSLPTCILIILHKSWFSYQAQYRRILSCRCSADTPSPKTNRTILEGSNCPSGGGKDRGGAGNVKNRGNTSGSRHVRSRSCLVPQARNLGVLQSNKVGRSGDNTSGGATYWVKKNSATNSSASGIEMKRSFYGPSTGVTREEKSSRNELQIPLTSEMWFWSIIHQPREIDKIGEAYLELLQAWYIRPIWMWPNFFLLQREVLWTTWRWPHFGLENQICHFFIFSLDKIKSRYASLMLSTPLYQPRMYYYK